MRVTGGRELYHSWGDDMADTQRKGACYCAKGRRGAGLLQRLECGGWKAAFRPAFRWKARLRQENAGRLGREEDVAAHQRAWKVHVGGVCRLCSLRTLLVACSRPGHCPPALDAACASHRPRTRPPCPRSAPAGGGGAPVHLLKLPTHPTETIHAPLLPAPSCPLSECRRGCFLSLLLQVAPVPLLAVVMAVPALQMSDLPPTHQERLVDFLSENNVHVRPSQQRGGHSRGCRCTAPRRAPFCFQFYLDTDGHYVANVRMYDPAVMEEMGISTEPKARASPSGKPKVRHAARHWRRAEFQRCRPSPPCALPHCDAPVPAPDCDWQEDQTRSHLRGAG